MNTNEQKPKQSHEMRAACDYLTQQGLFNLAGKIRAENDRLRAHNAELVRALGELHAIDERKLKSIEKRPYAIGIETVRNRVMRNRAILAKVQA